VATATGGGRTVQVFAPDQAKVDATGGGRILMNRPDYHSQYQGVELSVNKRLSNNWMARLAFSINDWTEYLDGPNAIQNPTRTDANGPPGGAGDWSGAQVNGGQIAPRSGGSGKGDIFYNARWQINANGFYQLPKGFEIGANLFGRQGYVEPLIISASAGADGTMRVLATPTLDETRYPNLWDLDARFAKTIALQRVRLLLSADLFNALNAATTLSANRNLAAASFGTINEIISPRILRVGVKFQF
jgi:hypothetical protein